MDKDLEKMLHSERCRKALLINLQYLTKLVEDDCPAVSLYFNIGSRDLKLSLKAYEDSFK